MPESDQRGGRVLGAGDVGQLSDIGRHVLPSGQICLSEVVETGRFAMPAQVDGVNDVAQGRQETGEAVVSPAVLGDARRDLHRGPRTDPAGREPFANEDRNLVDLRGKGEGFWDCGDMGGHLVPSWKRRTATPHPISAASQTSDAVMAWRRRPRVVPSG